MAEADDKLDVEERPTDTSADEAAAEELHDTAPPSTPPDRWRRLHTLSGALALGAFLVEHVVTNASALGGQAAYESVVGAMERSKLLPLVEIFIVVPLAFHAGNGLRLLARKSAPDSEAERYGDRPFWVLQRISGAVVLLFVLGHVWELRLQKLFFGLSPDTLHTTLAAHLSSTWAGIPWIALLYVLGIGATTFHFANGLFAATAAWNVATDPPGRRRMRIASSALGLLLFFIGGATVVGLATGTRLLPAGDADSAPCGSAVPTANAPAPASAPSR